MRRGRQAESITLTMEVPSVLTRVMRMSVVLARDSFIA
jgi:hypothetical protein